MPDEEFVCPLSEVESLENYFSQEFGPGGECRPCRLSPLASLYLGVLEQAGEQGQAEALSQVYEGGDLLTIARTMDNIKAGAKDKIRQDLRNLDCLVQSFQQGEQDAEEAR